MGETCLGIAAKGWLAGLAGSLALRLTMQAMAPPPPPEAAPASETAHEAFARKVGTCLFEKEMPESELRAWGELLHWSYGAAWGTVYGIIQSSLCVPAWLHGLLFGTVVWVAGPRFLLPAMKLRPLPRAEIPRETLMGWAFHAAYGLTVATVFGLLRLGRRE